jgi:hypothetical protein
MIGLLLLLLLLLIDESFGQLYVLPEAIGYLQAITTALAVNCSAFFGDCVSCVQTGKCFFCPSNRQCDVSALSDLYRVISFLCVIVFLLWFTVRVEWFFLKSLGTKCILPVSKGNCPECSAYNDCYHCASNINCLWKPVRLKATTAFTKTPFECIKSTNVTSDLAISAGRCGAPVPTPAPLCEKIKDCYTCSKLPNCHYCSGKTGGLRTQQH